MSAIVKVKLPTIEAVWKTLDGPKGETAMIHTATQVRAEVIRRWQSGKGADRTSLQSGARKDYLDKKEASGRNRMIDLNLGGGLARSFGVKKSSPTEAILSFDGKSVSPVVTMKGVKGQIEKDNLEVARALVAKRPQILQTDPSLQKVAITAFNYILRKIVKFPSK